MIRRFSLYLAFLLTGAYGQASLYWVYFTPKPESLVYSAPERLSAFTLQRRLQQGIPIDKADASIPQSWLDSLGAYGQVLSVSRWLNQALVAWPTHLPLPKWPFIQCMEPFKPPKASVHTSISAFRSTPSPKKANSIVNSQQLHQINISALHNLGYRGRGIRMAVFDAGFPYMDQIPAFQALFQEGRYLTGYDFVAGDSSIFGDNSHGTQVASVIVANDENIGYLGGAPEVTLLLARTEDALSETRLEEWNWARAAEWADSIGIHIIQSSLGYSTFDNPAENYTYADMNGQTAIITRAARTAARKGILVITSAGNEGASSWRYITAPADADSVIAAGAVNSSGQIAPFSSRGPTADGRIKPDLVALGWGTYIVGLSGSVQQASGTSFSAPLLSAMAACLWQAFPEAHAQEIRQALLRSASQADSPDTIYGYGIPDGRKALLHLTSLHKPQSPSTLQLYPNPARQEIRLFLPDTTLSRYALYMYDLQGQLVQQIPYRGHTEITLPLETLRPGLYWIQLRQEGSGHSYNQAFIKL